jgi:hypothetical protein
MMMLCGCMVPLVSYLFKNTLKTVKHLYKNNRRDVYKWQILKDDEVVMAIPTILP